MNIKNRLKKTKSPNSIASEAVKVEVSNDKNSYILTLEDLKKISLTYDISRCTISPMSKRQKYKTRYGKILKQAEFICKYYG